MPRPATRRVVVDKRWSSPTYGLKFNAYGQRRWVRLGTEAEAWTPYRAPQELDDTMAMCGGLWKPPKPVEPPREARDSDVS